LAERLRAVAYTRRAQPEWRMSTITEELHLAFVSPLRTFLIGHSEISNKPLLVDLALPKPPRLRLYIYSLVGGVGTVRDTEYKAVLRLPRQPIGEYASFDHSGDRVTLVAGYRADLDVFVFWDASLHSRFKNGGNIQVMAQTVHDAAAYGTARQARRLSRGRVVEEVIACRSPSLPEALDRRVATTGGGEAGSWAILQN
jgi:hypothetical protein